MKNEQFNTRVCPKLKIATKRIAKQLGWNDGEIIEVGLATLIGSKDPMVRAKRQKIQEAAKDLELCGTFNQPDLQLGGFSIAI